MSEDPMECRDDYSSCAALEDFLIDYATKRLPPELSKSIGEHVKTCGTCKREVAFWELLFEVLDRDFVKSRKIVPRLPQA